MVRGVSGVSRGRFVTISTGSHSEVSEYASAAGKKGGKMDAKPETKKANNYALNPKNKDGYDSKWQQGGKKGGKKGGMIDAKPETKKREQVRPQPQEQGWPRLQVAA